MAVSNDFIEALPKAELHLHIEGTLEPEMMFALAKRNGVSLAYRSAAELREAYSFADLQEFLDLYYQGTAVLLEKRDFYDLTLAYLERAHRQTVRHAEMFFDPQAHTERGVEFAQVIGGIVRAMEEAEAKWGISSRLIMCFLRHLDQDSAFSTLDQALAYRHHIVAVGLDSSEAGHPPGKFADVFAKARAEGFLAVAHAGEEGPAAYVQEAVERLGVSRIDHGNRSLEDPDLVACLAETAMPLTVCPLSNLRLGGVESLQAHPLKEMMNRGLKVTVNSDDPAYFGGYVNENLIEISAALDLGTDEVYRLARNGFEASFIPEKRRRELIAELDAYILGHAAAS